DGTGAIKLNAFVSNELSGMVQEIALDRDKFTLKRSGTDEQFNVRVFKFFSPKHQKSKLGLVAHKREVSGSVIHKYIPEFEDDFYESKTNGEIDHQRNYIIKAYVFGPYLDKNVSLERGGFEFQMETDVLLGISQVDIERGAAEIAKEALGAD